MQEDINNLKICMNTMKNDIGYIKDALEDNKEQHKEILEKIEGWIKSSKKEFAPKWVADAMKYIIGAFAIALIAKFMNLI